MKLVVVACNTAAAAALESLQARFPVPIIGVIEPGVRALAEATRTGRVGVIGTVGTIKSGAYQHAVHAASPTADLIALACPGFVEFVERGETASDQVHVLAERLLSPLVDAGIDALLLGCTHYPFLARTISDVVGRDVVLVSSADETAFEVLGMLQWSDLARGHGEGPGRHRFLSSGDVYDPDRVEADRDLIRRYYLKHGYADIQVVAALTEYDPSQKGFLVTFKIEEGQQYRVGSVDYRSTIPTLDGRSPDQRTDPGMTERPVRELEADRPLGTVGPTLAS